MVDEGGRPDITSQFDNEKGILHGVNVKKMARGAPLRVVNMVHTNISPEETWKAVIADLPKWLPGSITDVYLFRGSSSGNQIAYLDLLEGDVRHCLNKPTGDLLVEKFRYINHDEKLVVYSVDLEQTNIFFPVKNHTAAHTVESDGKGGSILTLRTYFDKTWNPLSLIITSSFRSSVDGSLLDFTKVYGGEVVRSKFYQ